MYSLSCFIFLSDVQCAFNCCLGKQQCKQTFITSHFYISVFFHRFFSSHKNYSSTGKIGKCIEGLNIYFPSIYSILLSVSTNQSFWVYTNVKQRFKINFRWRQVSNSFVLLKKWLPQNQVAGEKPAAFTSGEQCIQCMHNNWNLKWILLTCLPQKTVMTCC